MNILNDFKKGLQMRLRDNMLITQSRIVPYDKSHMKASQKLSIVPDSKLTSQFTFTHRVTIFLCSHMQISFFKCTEGKDTCRTALLPLTYKPLTCEHIIVR